VVAKDSHFLGERRQFSDFWDRQIALGFPYQSSSSRIPLLHLADLLAQPL
jgi:hypothetical protein